jgi:Zn-dependent protease with chaperone function
MPIELPPGTASYSDRSPPPKNRQFLLLGAFFAGLLVLLFWLVGWFAEEVITLLPYSVEQQLGAVIVPQYAALAQPSAAQDTLNQLVDRLETHLPQEQQQRDYQVLYIADETINAAAIPGDRIIVYKGLLDQMASENELMMVLGHELGHFAHRDHLRRLGRSFAMRLLFASFVGDLGGLQSLALSGVTAISNSRFSQRQEYQADDFGLSLLAQTYGHTAGATDFFERLSKMPGANIAFLSTHPSSKNRVRRLEQEIKRQGYPVEMRSPLPSSLKR